MAGVVRYPDAGPQQWQAEAACRRYDLDLFFGPPEGDHAEVKARRIRRAQAVCAGCPVQVQCLQHAVRYPEKAGIWGGKTPQQRAYLRTRVNRKAAAHRPGR